MDVMMKILDGCPKRHVSCKMNENFFDIVNAQHSHTNGKGNEQDEEKKNNKLILPAGTFYAQHVHNLRVCSLHTQIRHIH